MRDLARQLGVCHSTVSLALRNDPRISEERRKEVRRVAEEMGFRPDPVMSAFNCYRTGKRAVSIRASLVWLNFWKGRKELRAHREFAAYWEGARETAERNGYQLEDLHWDGSSPMRRLDTILRTRNVSGLLFPPVREQPAGLHELGLARFPFVRFGYSLQGVPGHVVSSDQLGDALLAFERMRAAGYARVGFVTYGKSFTRFAAGVAIGQLNLPASECVPSLVLPPVDSDGRLAAWLKAHRPDAILSDIPTIRSLLRGLGRVVPRDIGLAVTSVLDCDADAGINQNSAEIGSVAVKTLISLIHNQEVGIPRHVREVLVAGSWQDGASLPPRAAAAAGDRRSTERRRKQIATR